MPAGPGPDRLGSWPRIGQSGIGAVGRAAVRLGIGLTRSHRAQCQLSLDGLTVLVSPLLVSPTMRPLRTPAADTRCGPPP